jgi:predicted enzyme related to lactoylglutathione lyase
MANHHRVDYIEFPATDIPKLKDFYSSVFGWKFTDYGPDYTSFEDGRLSGGFDVTMKSKGGSPLVVIFSENLVESREKVAASGGVIVREIFDFPGGKRFHFTDPSGNELAVWSDK